MPSPIIRRLSAIASNEEGAPFSLIGPCNSEPGERETYILLAGVPFGLRPQTSSQSPDRWGCTFRPPSQCLTLSVALCARAARPCPGNSVIGLVVPSSHLYGESPAARRTTCCLASRQLRRQSLMASAAFSSLAPSTPSAGQGLRTRDKCVVSPALSTAAGFL
jgi:hypothetical protein